MRDMYVTFYEIVFKIEPLEFLSFRFERLINCIFNKLLHLHLSLASDSHGSATN